MVDEYGTMTGAISMEDVLEEIVGRKSIDETDGESDIRELVRSRITMGFVKIFLQ